MAIPSKVNKDLQEERNTVNFNIEEFTNFYYNGADKVAEKRRLGKNFKTRKGSKFHPQTCYF